MLNRLARKFGGDVGEVTLFASRRPRLAVIHGKRTKRFAFARHCRSGPAEGRKQEQEAVGRKPRTPYPQIYAEQNEGGGSRRQRAGDREEKREAGAKGNG
jgi:hypothetical protein